MSSLKLAEIIKINSGRFSIILEVNEIIMAGIKYVDGFCKKKILPCASTINMHINMMNFPSIV